MSSQVFIIRIHPDPTLIGAWVRAVYWSDDGRVTVRTAGGRTLETSRANLRRPKLSDLKRSLQ